MRILNFSKVLLDKSDEEYTDDMMALSNPQVSKHPTPQELKKEKPDPKKNPVTQHSL